MGVAFKKKAGGCAARGLGLVGLSLSTLLLVAALPAQGREREAERSREREPIRVAPTAAGKPAPRPYKPLKLDSIEEAPGVGAAPATSARRRTGLLALATGGLALVAVAWARRPRRTP